MKQPGHSGIEKGNKIFLKDILKHFDDFRIKEPIVWIVGGISNHGHTKGDIDILINLPPEESDTTVSKVIRFRIQRSLPEKYWARIHWLYNDGAGPFTSNVPLFSLDGIKMNLKRQEMSAATEIKPLRFFKQLKGKSGRFKKEIFSISALQKIIPEDAYPVEINMKYDGMRVQIHKAGDKVKIWSEDGGNVTDRFPTFVNQIKKHPIDIVLDVEITGEIKGKPIGRSDVSGYAHKKDEPDDIPFVANVHDIVYLGQNDLHKVSRDARIKILKGRRLGDKYKIIPIRVAKNKKELSNFVNFFSKQKGSEGAMIKQNDSIYELDGMTTKWWKFKKDFVIDAEVVKVFKIENAEAWSYLCTINNKIPIGKTFNTSIKGDVGDIIQVAFGNLNKYLDGEKVWYNWVFPRVISFQESKTKPDDIIEADLLNKESGGFIQDKSFPQRYEEFLSEEELIKDIENYNPAAANHKQLLDDHRITHAWASTILSGGKLKHDIKQIKKLHDFIVKEINKRGFVHVTPLELPREAMQQLVAYRRKMNKPIDLKLFNAFDEFMLARRKLRFVYQHHWRGASTHGDLRFEMPDRKALEGYTLAIQKEGVTKEPIDTAEKAKAERNKEYKIDYKTGEPIDQKILIFQKANQPLVWLDMKGVTSRTEPGEPPAPGATKRFPGVFDVVDEGLHEPGANKPFFKEYFMEGKIFKGRYIFRKLPRTGNLKDAGKVPWVWFFWKPKEQTPYILSTRAQRKMDWPIGDMAPSWLSAEWEAKIPKELRWWDQDLDREESAALIKAARKHLLEKNELSESYEQKIRFTLDRHWWKGQKVIRDLPVEHWDLRLSIGREWTLDKNPIFDPKDINAIYRMKFDIKGDMKVHDNTIIPPGEEGNPNKKIPAHVDTLDNGTANIVSDTEDFMSIEFDGKLLKGFFTFKRLDKGEQWILNKGKLPQTMSIMLNEFDIQQIIDLSDEQLRFNRSDIARIVGCSNTTVYAWQKRSELI